MSAREGRRATAILATALAVTALTVAGLVSTIASTSPQPGRGADRHAQSYLRLVSALGARDPDTLDAEGTPVGSGPTLSLAAIAAEARREAAAVDGDHDLPLDRRLYLIGQLDAVGTRASLLTNGRLTFDEELRRLFTFDLHNRAHEHDAGAAAAAEALAHRLPGRGSAAARLEDYDTTFTVPRDRLPVVFEKALAECRLRTRTHLSLPDDEAVEIGYVEARPWSGYSRYLGRHRSRITVNLSLPLTVDRVLELACHEGYPGHHVISMLRDAGPAGRWPERQVVPLFSPDAFVAESVASLAGSLAFSDDERLVFERDVLFPLAGLAPERAPEYLEVVRLTSALRVPLGHAIADYLAGDLDIIEATWRLQSDALMAHPLATLQFANRYRGYALAYTFGRAAADEQLGADAHASERWAHFRTMAAGVVNDR